MKPIALNPLWIVPIVAGYLLFIVLYFRRSQVRESIVDWIGRFGKVMNDWMNNVRTTNAKAIVTLALYVGTFAVWGLCSLYKIEIDLTSFGMWLAFLAGLGGFSLAQFKNERVTDYGYVERKNQGAPTTVVQTPKAEVTGSPVSVEPPASPPA